MDRGELVCGPDGEDDEEDKARQVDGTASAQTGVAADEDHGAVRKPHGEGQEDLGVGEEGGAVDLLGEGGADEKAGGHAGEAEEEGLEGDLVEELQRGLAHGKKAQGRLFGLDTALLDEVQEAGDQGEEESGVGGEE